MSERILGISRCSPLAAIWFRRCTRTPSVGTMSLFTIALIRNMLFTTYSVRPDSLVLASCRRRTSSEAPTRLPISPRPSSTVSSAPNQTSKRPGALRAARRSSIPCSTSRCPCGFSQWQRNRRMSAACFRVASCGETSE